MSIIIGVLKIVSNGLITSLEEQEIGGRGETHPNYSTDKAGQNSKEK